MCVKEIITMKSQKKEVLRRKCEEVCPRSEETMSIVRYLLKTLHNKDICIGLSAPQIGYNKRIFVINMKSKGFKDMVFINPNVIKIFGKKDVKKESCMSIPGYRGDVLRRYKVDIEFYDAKGDFQREVFKGFLARVIQHELDHLDGVLYTDRMSSDVRLERVDFFDE